MLTFGHFQGLLTVKGRTVHELLCRQIESRIREQPDHHRRSGYGSDWPQKTPASYLLILTSIIAETPSVAQETVCGRRSISYNQIADIVLSTLAEPMRFGLFNAGSFVC